MPLLALSGYLITSILLIEREKTGWIRVFPFYGRRARRLLPALLFFVAAVSAAMLAFGQADELLGDVFPVLGYHANFYPVAGGEIRWMAHTWSPAVEEQFYVLWPPILLLVTRAAPTLVLAVVAVVVLRALGTGPVVVHNTLAVADSLLLGSLLATAQWHPPRALVIATVIGLTLWAVSPLRDTIGTSAHLPMAVGVTVIVAGAAMARSAWRPLTGLGLISYGVYLWHFPLFIAGDVVEIPLIAFVPLAAVAILIAHLSHRCVERPLRTLQWSRVWAAQTGWVRPRSR